MTRSHSHRDSDVAHNNPFDRSEAHIWLIEDPTLNGNVLTQDGINQIAYHKYQAGEYTHLDNLMNPMWTNLTEFLPMSMAPNLVTTFGGLFSLLGYLATWYYLPQFEAREDLSETPNALLIFNGVAIFLYYTLDCMDGKQARRTGTSSPLGQLFDHGVDCFSTLTCLSACQSFLLMGPSKDYLWSQFGLQFAFFAPQWEEYFTGTLPHAYGKWLGVTEVSYGLALITMANTLIDYKTFYNQTVQQTLMPILPISILPTNTASPSAFVTTLNSVLTMKLKHFLLVAWVALATSIVLGCIYRTAQHIYHNPHYNLYVALTKFISPVLVAVMVLFVTPDEVIAQEARYVSVVSGLCICFLTIKMIVFSMARMAYASIQLDVAPLLLVLAFITWEYDYAPQRRLTPLGLEFLMKCLIAYYLIRIGQWAHTAIGQLTEKLDVYLFTIKPKRSQQNK